MKKLTLSLLAGVALLGFTSSGFAADLIIEDDFVEPGVVHVAGNWDGFYIGAHVGAGWGLADHDFTPPPFWAPGNDVDLKGWFAGVQAGANFSTGVVVIGFEGDASWANIGGSCVVANPGCFIATEHVINWMASLRGNLGFDAGAFMPYLTAGVVAAGADRTTTFGGGQTASATHVGWTVGGGVKVAVSDNVHLDFQYRYNDLGTQSYDFAVGTDPNVHLTVHTLRAGINVGF
jgi:outer membrane immunogenic protein